MKNIQVTMEGNILTIKVDLAREFVLSSSGETMIIASTEGNIAVPEWEEKVGLNGVIVNFYVTCGRCQFCRVGRDTLCTEVRQHGFSMDGGFAEYLKTPGVNLCKVPDHVPLEHACILGDAVATSYHAITKRAQVRPGTTLALIGVGGVGLHALQLAKMAGGWVIAVDVNDARLELARTLGADAVVDVRGRPFHEAVRGLTDGQGVDVVLDSSPTSRPCPRAI